MVALNSFVVYAEYLKKGEVYRYIPKGRPSTFLEMMTEQEKDVNHINAIEVISNNGLEITIGKQIILSTYNIKNSKLRIVFPNNTVAYYEIIKEGLMSPDGEILYSSAAIEAKRKSEEEAKAKRSGSKPEVDKAPMVLVKGGCFDMGYTFGDGSKNEKPVHQVCLDDFSIDKFEVTQKAFESVMGKNPSYFKDCPYCPVEQVTWFEANEYCGKVGKRLPTEAEWEYAARSGEKKEKWAGTSVESEIYMYAWYNTNSGSKTNLVGDKKPNALGLYDMTGNVWEWVADWYDENYYNNSPKDNPKGPDNGQSRVLRGGSWFNDARYARAADRNWYNPGSRDLSYGFRCVMTK